MSQPEASEAGSRKSAEWENEGGALAPPKPLGGDRFVVFERSHGSKVACQVSRIQFLANGENGAVLHFGGSSQVNVSQSFDEVLALLNGKPKPCAE
jgi:hypothetical protein